MTLKESPDASIRPTKAIVRKSVFERLEPWAGKTVCDLFAGIGTLGLEALSRGAAHITFVENDARALAVLAHNLGRIKAEDRVTVRPMDVATFLADAAQRFDVVLADPPYQSASWESLKTLVRDVIAPGGVFAMELASNASVPEDLDVRRYGKTKVCMWRPGI